MARRGVATVAVVAVLLVVIAGAGVFGYMYLLPSNHASSTTRSQTPPVTAAQTMILASAGGNLTISNAALSNDSLLVTVQNTGSKAESLDALVITPRAGCNLTSLAASRTVSQANQTGHSNQTRIPEAFFGCFAHTAPFAVQSNSTLTPISRGLFNASRLFNFSAFNFTQSFSLSANFSRTISGNFSRTISGNLTGFPGAFGNFSAGLGRFLGNLTNGAGLQLAAGQSVTLAYSGPIGSGVTAGSQYTIIVAGPQGEAQITISAS